LFSASHLCQEKREGAPWFGGWVVEVVDGRERAEVGVSGDLFDDLRFFALLIALGAMGFGLREVQAGDLKAVEKEAGSAGIDLVGGDALEDLADGELDGGLVLGEGQVELGTAVLAVARIGYGAAGGVVVVAEVFAAEAWAAAAVAVGEDVAALVAFRLVLHDVAPWVLFGQSLRKKMVRCGLEVLTSSFRLKTEARLLAGLFFSFYFYFIEVEVTKFPVWVGLFLWVKWFSFS
jgi:hypothetical protein